MFSSLIAGILSDQFWQVAIPIAAVGIGYWVRHQQGSGLPTQLETLLKSLLTTQGNAQAGGLLSDLLGHLPGLVPTLAVTTPVVVPAAPAAQPAAPAATALGGLPSDIVAALASLLTQQRVVAAHAALAQVVTGTTPAAPAVVPAAHAHTAPGAPPAVRLSPATAA